jgi:tRNA threonylcarbamoyladenosine biosynthesis protein TsaB
MMILAIETATIDVGVALVDENRTLLSSSVRTNREHGAQLHPAIKELMATCHVEFSGIDAIAIDVGPGLFTGLRVGVAAAKALGMALCVPLVPVRSTEALRFDARELAEFVVPVVDMRRGECAWELHEQSGLRLGTPEVLVRELSEIEGDCVLIGDGALRYGDFFAQNGSLRVSIGGSERAAPSPSAIGSIGWARLTNGGGASALEVEPIYLRVADAKVNFATRDDLVMPEAVRDHRRRGPVQEMKRR